MSDIHTCPQLYVPVQMFKVEKTPVLSKHRAPEPGRGQQEVVRIPLSGPEFSHEVHITDSAPGTGVDAPTVSQEDPRWRPHIVQRYLPASGKSIRAPVTVLWVLGAQHAPSREGGPTCGAILRRGDDYGRFATFCCTCFPVSTSNLEMTMLSRDNGHKYPIHSPNIIRVVHKANKWI
jgi:hypothetical protein